MERGFQRTVPSHSTRQSRLSGFEAALQAALRYLARRDRSEAHMTAYLGRLGTSPGRIRSVLRRLRALGYLDDEVFAGRWARDRISRMPMGRLRLEAELQAQGLDARTIADTIQELYAEISEPELARKLFEAAAVTPTFLRRRGFSEDTIETIFPQ